MNLSDVLTAEQTQKLLGISQAKLYLLRKQGKIGFIKVGGGAFFPLKDLRQAMKELVKAELWAERKQ
jgi:excisionase family DNA binding protein